MSLAVYTPGSDYRAALEAVHYWRQCSNTSLVADYVTFHFYFPTGHLPHHSFMSEEFSANYRHQALFLDGFWVVSRTLLHALKGSKTITDVPDS